jgi:hypothetical protein
MAKVDSAQTDTYVLSMKYDPLKVNTSQAQCGGIEPAVPGSTGNRVNAVTKNVGGTGKFVNGPWTSGYALGICHAEDQFICEQHDSGLNSIHQFVTKIQ